MDLVKVCESKIQRMALDVFYSGDKDFDLNINLLHNEIERYNHLRELDEISKKENL